MKRLTDYPEDPAAASILARERFRRGEICERVAREEHARATHERPFLAEHSNGRLVVRLARQLGHFCGRAFCAPNASLQEAHEAQLAASAWQIAELRADGDNEPWTGVESWQLEDVCGEPALRHQTGSGRTFYTITESTVVVELWTHTQWQHGEECDAQFTWERGGKAELLCRSESYDVRQSTGMAALFAASSGLALEATGLKTLEALTHTARADWTWTHYEDMAEDLGW